MKAQPDRIARKYSFICNQGPITSYSPWIKRQKLIKWLLYLSCRGGKSTGDGIRKLYTTARTWQWNWGQAQEKGQLGAVVVVAAAGTNCKSTGAPPPSNFYHVTMRALYDHKFEDWFIFLCCCNFEWLLNEWMLSKDYLYIYIFLWSNTALKMDSEDIFKNTKKLLKILKRNQNSKQPVEGCFEFWFVFNIFNSLCF